ncbi:MAG: type II secretion system protein [Phycisphaerales bacterium]|nr:type II secretion system protein [Phycisphaerales bacterium]
MHDPRFGQPGRRPRRGPVTGFTIVEVLVVMGIVAILVAILVVAMSGAVRSSARARTGTLLNTIKQGIVQFNHDHGYYPPVLGPLGPNADVPPADLRRLSDALTDGIHPVRNPGSYADDVQNWYSITSSAEYLLGWGSANEDGADGLGFRTPGSDGYWNGAPLDGSAAYGTLGNRKPSGFSGGTYTGKVFEPYLQLKDDRLLGSASGEWDPNAREFKVYFPGEAGFDPAAPKVICDYWGSPIRYYRRVYEPGAMNRPLLESAITRHTPGLADVIALRPFEIGPGAATNARFQDDDDDRTASRELQAADFALLSAGPDKLINMFRRADVSDGGSGPFEVNRDNLVELGP